jgi:UrcA family protein
MDFRNNRNYTAILAAAATVAAMTHAPASLGAADTTSIVVVHRDLNLAQPEGRAVLSGRVRAAARLACGAPEREELRAHFARRDCVKQAIATAMRDDAAGEPRVASRR